MKRLMRPDLQNASAASSPGRAPGADAASRRPDDRHGLVHLALRAGPEGLAELELLDLARGRASELVAELHPLRQLVASQPRAAVGDDLGLGDVLPLGE